MLNRNNDQKTDLIEHMRDGDGHVIRRTLIATEDSCGKFKMCAKITLEPGCSIGEHGHQPDAEFCYMLEGELTILITARNIPYIREMLGCAAMVPCTTAKIPLISRQFFLPW